MAYICPKHQKVMTDGQYGPYCASRDPAGKKGFCEYGSSKEFRAILAAERATPAPAPPARTTNGQDRTTSGGPRLEAAQAALAAAALVYQGTGRPAGEVMTYAARLYHKFLKPTFFGELPEPRVPEDQGEPSYEPGPDDDIPF